MRVDRKTQIPNLVVYAAIYGLVFGISLWLLIAHKDSPTNWLLYVAMIGSVLAGLVKFILHSRKQHSQSAHGSFTS
jgi:Co/Zn/Cd efflux system component